MALQRMGIVKNYEVSVQQQLEKKKYYEFLFYLL